MRCRLPPPHKFLLVKWAHAHACSPHWLIHLSCKRSLFCCELLSQQLLFCAGNFASSFIGGTSSSSARSVADAVNTTLVGVKPDL